MNNYCIWVDKYHPTKLDDIIGHDNIIKDLKSFTKSINIPNFIITGVSGIGKTATILCFLKELLNNKLNYKYNYNDFVLELNASDDLRKIDIIKKKIKSFIQKKNLFNFVVLDEIDNMIIQTQYVLRSLMDKYINNSKFIFICNDLHNIIEPIKSRSIIINFSKLNYNSIKYGLNNIIKNENININDNALDLIINSSNGDYRKSINNLQTVYTTFQNKQISEKDVYFILDIPHSNIIRNILHNCIKCNDFNIILQDINNLFKYKGYTLNDLIDVILQECKNIDMDTNLKIEFIQKISFTHIKIINGLSTINQLTGLISKLYLLSYNYKKNKSII